MNSISYIANKVDDALHVQSNHINHSDLPTQNDLDGTTGEHLWPVLSPLISSISSNPSETVSSSSSSKQKEDITVPYIIQLILYIPNLLIIRPILFSWFVITYPLTVVEQIRRNKNKSSSSTTSSSSSSSNKSDTKDQDRSSIDISSPISNLTIVEMDEEVEKLDVTESNKNPTDLKSPTSPSLVLSNPKQFTFPKTVFPVSLVNSNIKKTLILDLDETLVHSLSRGTRMSNGHMVEVKLKDQVATLYSVHKRPYCDMFLKQVSKWYNLVIFTASVKEYADPVIDLLESEGKFFLKRFYRNHCTLREGQGYIKDLTAVDKNLNNLIIVDNSPISYALHENNAIIVEGWINDPSDTDLLNLIPLLDALRYTTDVRPILSLKNGEIAFER